MNQSFAQHWLALISIYFGLNNLFHESFSWVRISYLIQWDLELNWGNCFALFCAWLVLPFFLNSHNQTIWLQSNCDRIVWGIFVNLALRVKFWEYLSTLYTNNHIFIVTVYWIHRLWRLGPLWYFVH